MASMIRTLRRSIIRNHARPILIRRAAVEFKRHEDKTVIRTSGEGIGAWLNRLFARFAPRANSVLPPMLLRNLEQERIRELARAERHRTGVRAV